MREVVVDGGRLSQNDVVAVAYRQAIAVPATDLERRMAPALRTVAETLTSERVAYGVNTGFGALATVAIDSTELPSLQVRLLRSHAAGVGPQIAPELVRAMMLLRARTLAQGHSGVRPLLVERLIALLKNDALPVIPAQGSVGASGDLAPFAHLALPLIGEGMLNWNGQSRPAGDVLTALSLAPVELQPKEGLSLLNGTEGMLAMGVLAAARVRQLAAAADIACALSVEALTGSARPFRPEIHALRPHPGQIKSAERIASILAGSGIGESHIDDFQHAVQDAYSLRCAPQVHGACLDTLDHASSVFDVELGSVVDNPLVLPDSGEIVSAGNFHGQPLAFCLDFLSIAATELSSISERRTDRLLDPQHSSGLPAFLSPRPGLNSGYMLAQYTAAALVAENRVLSHPASVESIPTSGSQEDHVSMGWGAGRKLGQILDNAVRVIAVEILCAVQGIEYRAPLQPGSRASDVVQAVRDVVASLTDDRPIGEEIETVAGLIEDGTLQAAARISS